METLSIIKERGHIILPIGDKRAVLDTGAQVSMAPEPFTFLGRTHTVPANLLGVTPQSMGNLAGFPIDIMIGCDILKDCTVRLRWRDGIVDIGDDVPDGKIIHPLELLQGLPVFPVELAGSGTRAVFDSGAHLSYIDPECVCGWEPSGEREDFHPFAGRYTTALYRVATALDPAPVEIEYGIMPDPLKQVFGMVLRIARISAVIGTQLLEHFDCTISWPRRTISWSR